MNSPHSLGPTEYSTHLHSRFQPYSKDDSGKVFRLRAEVFDDSDHSNIEAAFEVPGVTPSDIKVFVKQEMLIIQGQRLPRHYMGPHLPIAPPSTPTRSQPRVTMPIRPIAAGVREFHYGKFCRALRLPSGTNVEKIRAALSDGVLTVTWPRTIPPQNSHERK
ncbi:HSP20-like chaperone, partial [Mycena olivaceomarginata]